MHVFWLVSMVLPQAALAEALGVDAAAAARRNSASGVAM